LNYNLRLGPILIRQYALNYPLARADPNLRSLQVLAVSINKRLTVAADFFYKVIATVVRNERYLVNKMLCLQFARADVLRMKIWVDVKSKPS